MPPAPNIAPVKKWVAPLRGFGIVGLLVGCLFFMVGGLAAVQRYVQATEWPVVLARVDECSIHNYYHIRSHVSGEQDQVRCVFQYEAGGVTYQQVKDAGSSVFYSSKEVVIIQPKVTRSKLTRWISLHPKGSTQAIHYNPADPREISLAGADDDIQENIAQMQLKIAATLLSVGLVSFFASFAVREKNTDPGAQPVT